jgi:hypothetical protein
LFNPGGCRDVKEDKAIFQDIAPSKALYRLQSFISPNDTDFRRIYPEIGLITIMTKPDGFPQERQTISSLSELSVH